MTEYFGVGCSRAFFCYSENGMQTKPVDRSKVQRAVRVHGAQAQYPVALVVFGAVMISTLAWPALRVWDAVQYGGSLSNYDFYIGALSPLGGWLIYEAFKRGWVLRLELELRVVKLAFNRGADLEGVRAFARRASSETGLPVETPRED